MKSKTIMASVFILLLISFTVYNEVEKRRLQGEIAESRQQILEIVELISSTNRKPIPDASVPRFFHDKKVCTVSLGVKSNEAVKKCPKGYKVRFVI